MVETKEDRKARKEHESASHVEGLKATLDAGRARDEAANVVPTVKEVKKVTDFLVKAVKEREVIEEPKEIEDPVVEEPEEPEPEVAEEEPEKDSKAEALALMAKLKEFLGSE